jgi:hypothetical protein
VSWQLVLWGHQTALAAGLTALLPALRPGIRRAIVRRRRPHTGHQAHGIR